MTEFIIGLGLWTFLAISYFYSTWDIMVDKQFKKFYPHPQINLHKSLKANNVDNKASQIATDVTYSLLYLPITPVWFIAWCVYKVVTRGKKHNKMDKDNEI